MHFIVARDTLRAGLQTVLGSVPSTAPIPILKHVLLTLAPTGQLRLAAGNLTFQIAHELSVECLEPGCTTVPAHACHELVQNLPAAPLELRSDSSDQAILTCGRSQYQLLGLPPEQFPNWDHSPDPDQGPVLSVSLPVASVATAFRQVLFATAKDDALPLLTGVLFEFQPDRLLLAATDRHRLAFQYLPYLAPPDLTDPVQAIVPARAVRELARLLRASLNGPASRPEPGPGPAAPSDSEPELAARSRPEPQPTELLQVQLAGNLIRFQCQASCLATRLIEGRYPDPTRVLPDHAVSTLTLDRSELRAALKRSQVIVRHDTHPPISLLFQPDQLVLTASSSARGKAREELPALLEGEPGQVSFCVTYLLDVLAVLETDQVQLALAGPNLPGRVTDPAQPDYFYLVMPLQFLDSLDQA